MATDDLQSEEGFKAFVAGRRDLWMRLAYRVLENREEAEDTVQETLAVFWEKRKDLVLENPGAYAARAVWLNSLKRRTRSRPHVSLDDVPELAAPEAGLPAEGPPSLDPLELEQAIQELPESQQTVIRMKFYLGLSFREIGEALQISLNTAGSRCRYALEALRNALGIRRQTPSPQWEGTKEENHE